MTLFKQMSLAVSVIIIMLLASVMTMSYQSTKKDMLESVYQTSVNNISGLANSLAEVSADKAYVATTIDAAFDSGYYKLIEYESRETEFIYKQEDKQRSLDVPSWFVSFANVELEVIEEDVVSGWKTVATLKIAGDDSIVYSSLYQTFKELLYLFAIFLLVSFFVMNIVLSMMLKPLTKIKEQAESILNDEFVIQKKMPYTREFKEVVKAMNIMVQKVEYIFVKGGEALKRNQELLYIDPVTKLYNRRYLMLKLPDTVALQNKINGGTIFFAAMANAEHLNKVLGREDADKMFCSIATIFLEALEGFDDGIAARVNGTEFMLVLPECDAKESLEIAKKIHQKYEILLSEKKILLEDVNLDIGMYRYRPDVKISSLLTRADNALSQAVADEFSSTYIFEEKDDENAMGKEQWREIIEESIQKRHFALKFLPMIQSQNKSVEHYVMTFIMDDKLNKNYFYGDFIAPAINLGFVSEIYMVVLKELITKKHDEIENAKCSVRLSGEFLKDPMAFESLAALLSEHKKALKFELTFEVSDSFAIKYPMLLKQFVALFKEHDCGFGINSFTSESDDFAYLREFNPDFIKADVSFLLDQTNDSMSAFDAITNSLGIKIIATFVKTFDEVEALKKLNVYKLQGPITDSLTP